MIFHEPKDYINLLLKEAAEGTNPKSEFKHCIDEGYIRFHHNSYIGQKLKELLNAPIMPEHPSDELLAAINKGYVHWSGNAPMTNQGRYCIYNTLRAALLTPPKPKMKTVWYIAFHTQGSGNVIGVYVNKEEAALNRTHMTSDNGYSRVSPIWSEEVEDK